MKSLLNMDVGKATMIGTAIGAGILFLWPSHVNQAIDYGDAALKVGSLALAALAGAVTLLKKRKGN